MSIVTPPASSPTDSVGEAQLSESLGSINLGAGTEDAEDEAFESANTIVTTYLRANVPIFDELCETRKKVSCSPASHTYTGKAEGDEKTNPDAPQGWENPAGDAHFQKQQKTADNANEKVSKIFYNMMKSIAADMHAATGAFTIHTDGTPRILDMCMAPGGYLATALSKNPGATAVGFSLPESQGGHKTRVPRTKDVQIRYLDITMLAEDMGFADDRVPADHPDRDSFLPRQLGEDEDFHLVLCDGQVLRTHDRAEYRQRCEARRLTLTQLALGLGHLRPGGTMVVLLHRVESWNNVQLLRDFCGFAGVRLFKPAKSHATRSSFYMVARDVRSRCPEALAAVARWKKAWEAATFRLDDGEWEEFRRREPDPHEVLREFGEELVRLGTGVWEIQAEALKSAPFIRDRKG